MTLLTFYLTQPVINIKKAIILHFFILNLQNLVYILDLQHNLIGTSFNDKCSRYIHSACRTRQHISKPSRNIAN